MTIERELARIKNEVLALKMASQISYGMLEQPETAPSVSFDGTINVMDNSEWEITFTRSDGMSEVPVADFTFDYETTSYDDWVRSIGGTAVSPHPEVYNEELIETGIKGTATGAVVYFVRVHSGFASYVGSTVPLKFNVTTISPVEGTLVMQRIL